MTYLISTTVTISYRTKVEANNEEQAKVLARERTLMDTPYNIGGEIEHEFIIEDFDGEPNSETLKVTEYE